MRKWLAIVLITGFSVLMACDDQVNRYDLERDPLKGKINGTDWQYKGGSSLYDALTSSVTGIIFSQEAADPCGIRITSSPHMSVKLPTTRGSYNLPFIGDQYYIRFSTGSGVQYTATSGFVDIVEVTSLEIIGYISADFDDQNAVQGAFLQRICN